MKISNSAVSGRPAPSYEEFVDLEFDRFLRDPNSPSFSLGCNTTALKVKMMEFLSWDSWAPNASKLAHEVEQYKWLSTATFHRFGELPPELRNQIWEYAIAPHREAKVHCLRERNRRWISNQPTSHFLHACHESRDICLQKSVVAAFQTYFNPDIDIAYIPDLVEENLKDDVMRITETASDAEEPAGAEGDEMRDIVEGVDETEVQGEDIDMNDRSEHNSNEDFSVANEPFSFARLIYSKCAKHVQILATRKDLFCQIPLEGHMSETHYEMRQAMPNLNQTVVVFVDGTTLDQAFRNIDYCFRDLSVKEKKCRAERSYARAFARNINRMVSTWGEEPRKYRWVVPNRQIETEKRLLRKFGSPAGR
ncbi:hypothetical protein HYALB_00013952 [Hymenoscyphus albidus]|uniref:2EXR domain-containing protein n=1 Tax=Hymenoscyphus albidus TaxID=595503 RepID=A0A9N9Q0N9_9HELO|nr:hypothetical protein HYALB_00013952 [Hymenoscyphus albidus]